MSTYAPTPNENWIVDDNSKALRRNALKVKAEHDDLIKGKKERWIKHPELKNTWIIKHE